MERQTYSGPDRRSPRPKRLVITVHGIRTFGGWQERLEELLVAASDARGESLRVVHYKFGYFSAFAFVSFVLRSLVVRRFRRELMHLGEEGWQRIDIVAHSFGTYVVAKSLVSLRRRGCPPIDTLILAGSVLPSRFRWSELVPGCVRRVVNECGTRDQILLLSQALPLLGMAGRNGFQGMTGSALRNRFFNLGHSGYFLDNGAPSDFMARHWVPILIAGADAPAIDERPAGWKSSVEAFLLNNANPLKVAAYCVIVAAAMGWGVPYVSRQIAQRVVTNEKGYIATEKGQVKLWFDSGAVPAGTVRRISSLGPIDIIDFASTKVTDADVESLPASGRLKSLYLSDTAVTGRSLAAIRRFENLEELRLWQTPLRDLAGLPSTLRHLKLLDLQDTGIDDADLAALAPLVSLEDLDLSSNPIRGGGLKYLGRLGALRELSLSGTDIDDAALTFIGDLVALRVLNLSGTRLRGNGLGALAKLRNVDEINLSFTLLDDAGLSKMPVLPKLRAIELQNAENLKGPGFRALASLPALEELWLKDTRLDSGSLAHLENLENLRILALPGTNVGAGSLRFLKKMRSLKKLYLGGVEILDGDLDDVAALPSLELLYLPGNPQITDGSVDAIARLPRLRELSLERTSITAEGRDRLQKTHPGLKILY